MAEMLVEQSDPLPSPGERLWVSGEMIGMQLEQKQLTLQFALVVLTDPGADVFT
jgi:hypothetical protein